ncbi:MAG: OmpA family protein [Elusimicrobiota bacterium]
MPLYKKRKDDLENELNKGALWAVVYGDLMSYLMIFFLVLFSFSVAKSDKTKNRKYEESLANIQKVFGGIENKERIEKAMAIEKESVFVEKIKETTVDENMKNFLKIEQSEKKIKLVLTDAVLFDSGKAVLKERAKEVLLPIIEELKKIPNDIIIEGHTDSLPIKGGRYATNWELSMARAYSVIEFMQLYGLETKRLAGIGYGDNRPVAENTTSEGRAKNRRIEISLIKTE